MALVAAARPGIAAGDYFGGQHGVAVVLGDRGKKVLFAHRPEVGRALVAEPGSVLKPIVLNALLSAGKLKATETLPCSGVLRIGGHNLACVHPRLGVPLDVRSALAYSCNEFVAKMAARFDPAELAAVLRRAGLGAATGLAGPGEAAGSVLLVHTQEAVQLQALGAQGIAATVYGVARAYQRLAGNTNGAVRAGLVDAVEFGTAQEAAISGVRVAGKTGSASGGHAWFAGFAPADKPRFTVAVLTQGYSGGADAAPIGARLLRAAMEGRL